ncbi:MAG: lytic transglycosylase domain-containing protein [Armatimonadota bacterium]|nr:lytic transglycosylase domain-containing protein [Armatimonadota bacterium]MCX7777533.1 lytic transglycosylase domain-containing protein [Armatimonadota bacterium]MDW8026471.1 lytic transglycosylase domain-containing protein [Armatimonadota bacterium]
MNDWSSWLKDASRSATRGMFFCALMVFVCTHCGAREAVLAQGVRGSNNSQSAAVDTEQRSDIINYDEVKPIVSIHRGRLIRIAGRLTSLVIARGSVTYGITARDGSLVFVRGSLPPKYTHTGVAVTVVARVPETVSSVLTLELVDFEQTQMTQSPTVTRSYNEQMGTPYQMPVERSSGVQHTQHASHGSTVQFQQSAVQAHLHVISGQANAIPIYSAWGAPSIHLMQGTIAPSGASQPYMSQAVFKGSPTPQIQPAYATPPIQSRGSMPSRGINYIEWRNEYVGRAAQHSSPSIEGEVRPNAKLRPNFVWQSFPSPDAIQAEIQNLLLPYKRVALYFNPSLNDEQATKIVRALLYYSMLYGVDPRFVVAVIAVESSFRPNAVGQKGEIGLGQLMPGTAASLGLSNPFDIEQNIEGCVRLLSRYLSSYAHLPPERQIALALACYNAGPNAVAKYGGVPPYPITQRYISKVTELYKQLCGIR